MKWKGVIVGYITTLIIYYIFAVLLFIVANYSFYGLSVDPPLLPVLIVLVGFVPGLNFFHLISIPIGYFFGWRKDLKELNEMKGEEKNSKKNQNLNGERKRLSKIKYKIRKWKKEGYQVDELKQKVDNLEIPKNNYLILGVTIAAILIAVFFILMFFLFRNYGNF